jgi:sialidase-1
MFSKTTLAFLLAASAISRPLASGPLFTQANLFAAGDEGRKIYRIPGMVVTKKGTVLVYCEGRLKTGGDWDTIDIFLRRSTDGGKTFSPARIVGHVNTPIERSPVAIERKQGKPEDITYNNPAAIADRNGAVHFLFCIDYMRVFYMRSDDDGKTFTKPAEITSTFDSFRPAYNWRVVATGPGHGIQLQNGRLLMPVWMALGTRGNGHAPSCNSTIYSDDHGRTWHRGDIAVPDTPEFPSANETMVVQLADGRVMLNARTPSPRNRRVVAVSKDGATHWSAARYQDDLPDPICEAALVRFSRNRILFSNPDNLTRADGKDTMGKDRKNVTVRLSSDEGASWPVKRTIEPGPSGYSDLAVLTDRTILCFYESAGKFLTLARFNLEWLTKGQESFGQ